MTAPAATEAAPAEAAPPATHRLQRTWTVILLAVALVPLAGVALRLLEIQRAGLVSVEQDLELAVADDAGRSASAALDEAERVMNRVARLLASERIRDEEARLDLVREAIGASDLVAWVSVFARDGTHIGSIEKTAGAAAKELGAHDASGQRWTLRGSGDDLAAEYVVPLVADGATTGYLLAAATMTRLDTTVADLSTARFGRPDRIVVVDAARRVVAGGQGGLRRGSTVPATHALFARAPASEATFSLPLDVHTSFVASDGVAMLSTLRTLPAQRWAVLVERPEREAFRTLTDSRRELIASALVVGVLAAAIAAYLARRTTRPITQLVELTEAYARRELDRPNPVTDHDELGRLGDALARMARRLSESEREIRRRVRLETGLARYLPAEAAEAVAEASRGGADALALLASKRRRVTVVFADVAGFTSFVERAPPEKVVAFLNELFTLLSEIVFRHGGMVDKFLGDAVMAVFGIRRDGSDASDADHVARAIAAADDMQRFVEAAAPRWRSRFDLDVKLGIGLASGEALVGNLGSDLRVDFTAIGDIVNVAARLEGIARPGQVLVSAEVAAASSPAFVLASLGVHPLRGKSAPVEVFELVR